MKFIFAHARFPGLLLLICLVAASSLADDNVLGLFYDTDASINEIDISPHSVQALYLVLINPVNDSYDGGGIRDVDYVSGFECAIEVPNGDVLLDVVFATPAINVGSTNNIIAGFGTAVLVSRQRAATLATFSVLTAGNNPDGYRVGPASPATVANTMAYVDYEDPDLSVVEMSPVSGSFDRPVFTFGDYTVDEDARWGAVKALYR